MSKILLFLFVIGLGSIVTFGVMMPELNLILMDVLVIEGKADVSGDFVCECLDDLGVSHVCDPVDFGTTTIPGPYFESAAICNYIPLP